jgi:DNA polymerase I
MASALFPAGADDVLYIVDLSGYVLRAYHAIAPLSSPNGEPTHAVHGTLSMLERLIRERKPKLFAIALDSGRETFRKEMYPSYKANRPPAPDDLRIQLRRCSEIVRAFAIPVLVQQGVEADDLIATLVKQGRAHGLRMVIVGADKDLMQLVAPEVVMWDTMRDRVFGPAEVEERFGVPPEKLGDVLALMGDTSDNIPGVPGVGPKTASELIRKFGSLNELFAQIDQLEKKKLRENLLEHKADALMSRALVALKDDCDIELDVRDLRFGKRDTETLRRIYSELGFVRHLSLLDQLETPAAEEERGATAGVDTALPRSVPTAQPEVAPGSYRVLVKPDELEALAAEVRKTGTLALEVATPSAGGRDTAIIGLGLAASAGEACYLPFGHRYVGAPTQLSLSDFARVFRDLLTDRSIKKLSHNLKRCRTLLLRNGLDLDGFGFDAHLASYLLDPEADHALETISQRELGMSLPTYAARLKPGRGQKLSLDELSVEETLDLVAPRADVAARLAAGLRDKLDASGLQGVYDDVELPLAHLLAELEQVGVLVDTSVLGELGVECDRELQRLEAEAHRIAKKSFNVNSPRQLETLLFDELGLKPLKRTKTSRSTDADTLEALSEEHELPSVILEIRQVSKLKGTYIDALPNLVDRTTGRIHSSWEQAVAATGRLSSIDPNLQNIPIRTELGRRIRAAFVAPPGSLLLSADYSQIELRVLAHLSQDPVLLAAFRADEDIHTRTAMEIFEVPADQVTREMRTKSKAVNFGVIYGQGDSGLAKALGISRTEAGDFIAAYFRRYAGVRTFMHQTLEAARAGEAVKSLLGRRRLVPDIRSGNRAQRLAAERIAMNMPIQGTAADLLKLAMLKLAKPVTPGMRMVLTVHDELVFEVPENQVESAIPLVKQAMEQVYPLDVPLVVEVGSGKTWMSAH